MSPTTVDDDCGLAEATSPSRPCRIAVSLVVVIHFAAILTAVTGAQSGRFAPPTLCAEANAAAGPYLRGLYLDSSYRFFAPNPWADNTLWIRISFARGVDRWLQWPTPDDVKWSVPYKRNLGLTQIADSLTSDADEPTAIRLAAGGRICLASYARRIGRDFAIPGDRITQIEFFLMSHRPLSIAQVRAGWEFDDLRLYDASFFGRFSAEGDLLSDHVREVSTANLAVLVLADCLRPFARHADGLSRFDPTAAARELGVPHPVVELVARNPDLLTVSRDRLAAATRQAVMHGGEPDRAGVLLPGIDYAEDWVDAPG